MICFSNPTDPDFILVGYRFSKFTIHVPLIASNRVIVGYNLVPVKKSPIMTSWVTDHPCPRLCTVICRWVYIFHWYWPEVALFFACSYLLCWPSTLVLGKTRPHSSHATPAVELLSAVHIFTQWETNDHWLCIQYQLKMAILLSNMSPCVCAKHNVTSFKLS